MAIYHGLGQSWIVDMELSPLYQVIMASDIDDSSLSRRGIRGFGISLSGGHNMDGQGYTDLLVGAHRSSHVVVLR